MVLKIILFILMVLGYFYEVNAIEPLIKNQLAISQMNNGSYGFILLHSYPYVKWIFIFLSGVLLASIVKDLVKKYKNKKENKDEN